MHVEDAIGTEQNTTL